MTAVESNIKKGAHSFLPIPLVIKFLLQADETFPSNKGYISQKLFELLFQQGLELIITTRKNMKNRLLR